MKSSELRKKLEELEKACGDLDVWMFGKNCLNTNPILIDHPDGIGGLPACVFLQQEDWVKKHIESLRWLNPDAAEYYEGQIDQKEEEE